MSDSERLKAVLDYVKKNRNSFALSIGLERPVSIYAIMKGEYGISVDLAKSITDTYKEINYRWLLEGKGEMLLASSHVNDSEIQYKLKEDCVNEVEYWKKIAAEFEGQVKLLKEQLREAQSSFQHHGNQKENPNGPEKKAV